MRSIRQGIPMQPDTHRTALSAGTGPVVQSADKMFGLLLVTARQAASMCGKSLRTWRTWDAAGWIPRPIRIGRSTLWRADELRDWIATGCPRRAEWEARK